MVLFGLTIFSLLVNTNLGDPVNLVKITDLQNNMLAMIQILASEVFPLLGNLVITQLEV
jgi:hypothetical protein